MRLKDKVAVVTGASDEFARAIAVGYAREGAVVFLQDFEGRASGLEVTVVAVRETEQKELAGVYDITHAEPVDGMTKRIMEEFGHIDVLVNTTAGGWYGRFFEATEANWDRALDRGLKAQFLTCQRIGKEMARRASGKIINITAIVGRIGSAGAIPWGAARGGVDSMTSAIAQDLGQDGINCTALARGASTSQPIPRKQRPSACGGYPSGGWARPLTWSGRPSSSRPTKPSG